MSDTASVPSSTVRPPRPTVGSLLARYRLLEEVGQGGMAIVWRAEDTALGREVAVKVLHPHLANQDESRARLEREAHAVAKLRHDNILEIYDYSGQNKDDRSAESFLVTEFIHGQTLRQFLNQHPLAIPEIGAMIASEIALALEHAHSHGVIHRDIKPENVMIRRDDGRCKLMDFGIAQIVDKERMTMTGQLMGSPAYMAPEHIDGKVLDFRTDIFALGILAYQLVSGELPFRGKNPHEVLRRIADCRFQPASVVNPLVGTGLENAIGRALKRDPAERYSDIARFRAELLSELADAGITEVRRELAEYFKDPAAYEKQRLPRIIDALTVEGRRHANAGRRARAIALWCRALAYAPQSAELQAAIAGLTRRQTATRVAMGLTAFALLGGAAWWNGPRLATMFAVPTRSEPARPTKPNVEPNPRGPDDPPNMSTQPNGTSPVGSTNQDPRPKPTPTPSTPRPTPRPTPTPPLPTPAMVPQEANRTIELNPTPKAVKVTLDGKPLGDFGPALTNLTLTPGKHTLLLESQFCFPETREIKDAEAGKVTVRLRWKPASLTVFSKPEGADVIVDGKLPMRAGQSVPLAIADQSNGRRTVKLQVSLPGHETKELEVAVTASENKELTVPLLPR